MQAPRYIGTHKMIAASYRQMDLALIPIEWELGTCNAPVYLS